MMQLFSDAKEIYKKLFFYPKYRAHLKSIDGLKTLQISAFEQAGISAKRSEAISKLNAALEELGFNQYIESGPQDEQSEHLVAFSAISIENEKNNSFKRILEIGTWDGKAACILSKLFPNALITTIDLPDNDPLFINTYNRQSTTYREKLIKERNNRINQQKRL